MQPSQPDPASPAAPATRERSVTRIAQGTRIAGEVTGNTEVVVEGELEGTVRIGVRAVVGASGVVRGEIEAGSIMVSGAVYGDVRGRERVEVGTSGRIEGDIAAPRVTIAEGAFFKGKVEMTGDGRRSPGARKEGDGPGAAREAERKPEPGGAEEGKSPSAAPSPEGAPE